MVWFHVKGGTLNLPMLEIYSNTNSKQIEKRERNGTLKGDSMNRKLEVHLKRHHIVVLWKNCRVTNLAQNEIRKILCSSQLTIPIPPESWKRKSRARLNIRMLKLSFVYDRLYKYLEVWWQVSTTTSRWIRSEGWTVPAAFTRNWTSDRSISTFWALAGFLQCFCSQTL